MFYQSKIDLMLFPNLLEGKGSKMSALIVSPCITPALPLSASHRGEIQKLKFQEGR